MVNFCLFLVVVVVVTWLKLCTSHSSSCYRCDLDRLLLQRSPEGFALLVAAYLVVLAVKRVLCLLITVITWIRPVHSYSTTPKPLARGRKVLSRHCKKSITRSSCFTLPYLRPLVGPMCKPKLTLKNLLEFLADFKSVLLSYFAWN